AAANSVATGEGKRLMDQIWHGIGEMSAVEEQLLAARHQQAQTAANKSLAFILVGSVLAGIVGLAALMLVRKDMRRRTQAERSLEESRGVLQSMLDNMPAIVFIKDLEGRYVFVNLRFEQLAGLPREQIKGKTVYDLSPK